MNTTDYDSISGATEVTAILVDDGGGSGFNNTTAFLCDEYFIMPHPDPELAECTSMVCQRDLEVGGICLHRPNIYYFNVFEYLIFTLFCAVLARIKCLSSTPGTPDRTSRDQHKLTYMVIL